MRWNGDSDNQNIKTDNYNVYTLYTMIILRKLCKLCSSNNWRLEFYSHFYCLLSVLVTIKCICDNINYEVNGRQIIHTKYITANCRKHMRTTVTKCLLYCTADNLWCEDSIFLPRTQSMSPISQSTHYGHTSLHHINIPNIRGSLLAMVSP